MSVRQQYALIIAAVLCLTAAFGLGAVTGVTAGRGQMLAAQDGTGIGETAGHGGLLGALGRLAQITSGAFENRKELEIPGATNLNSLEVIWEVREKVKQQFVFPVKDDAKLTYGAIRGMLASLDDPYTRFLDPDEFKEFRTDNSGHFDGVGAVLESKPDEKGRDQVFISSILEEGPAAKSNLRAGDYIVKVDKTIVEGMPLNSVVKLIRGMRGTPVTITVIRKGVDKPIEVTVIRANIEVKVVEYKMLDPEKKIGYIWLRQFNQNATREMQAALTELTKQGMKGLVFDLSSDPGGILDAAVEVGSFFISDGPIVWIKNRGEDPQSLNAIPGKAIPKDIKVVTLVDPGSASASEIVSGALQDTKRALIVGQHTFGKAKVQTICELQDQSALFLTTALYLTPKMRDIGQKDAEGNPGVKPDVRFPEPDPAQTDFKPKEWHEKQVDLAKAELLKMMAK